MKNAKHIRDLDGFRGHAALYQMDPPHDGSEFVIASAINNEFGMETYLFPSNAQGEIVSFSEMEGSMRGTTEHSDALESAGYKVTQ